MANTDADTSNSDFWNDPLVPESQPIPGIVHGAITGIHGVVAPSVGMWGDNAYGSDVPLGGPGTWRGPQANAPLQIAKAFGSVGKDLYKKFKENTQDIPTDSDKVEADFPATQSAVPEVSPAVDDQAHTRNTLPDILAGGKPPTGSLADKIVKTTTEGRVGGRVLNGPYDEARSGDNPGAASAPAPGGDAAPPPTAQQPNSGFSIPGMLGRFFQNAGNFFDANRYTLMALGGGLAGSQSWGQGIGRGLQAASRVQPLDVQNNYTAQALQRLGIQDPVVARAMASNPELMKELLPFMTGTNKQWSLGEEKDLMGVSHPFLYSPITGERRELSRGGATGGAGGLPGGITPDQWDQLTPDQRFAVYKKQYPELAGALQAYHEGRDVPPTRMPAVKLIAPNIWPDYNDNVATQNKDLTNQLTKSSASSTGGIILNGLSTFGHYADAAEAAANVGDVLGADSSLPNWVGHGANAVYNYGIAGQDQASKLQSQQEAFGKAGTEGTKFYAATGGSAPERMEGKEVSKPSATAGERVGWLREGSKLMLDRLQTALTPVMSNPAVGKPWLQQNIAMLQKAQYDISRSDRALAQLDPNGDEARALKTGQMTPAMQRFEEIIAPAGLNIPQTQRPPQTQQTLGSQQQQQNMPPPYPPDPAQRQNGQVYLTPSGPARWMGNGWQR